MALIRRMSAINAINLSRFFIYFIPQDPDSHSECGSWSLDSKNSDPDPHLWSKVFVFKVEGGWMGGCRKYPKSRPQKNEITTNLYVVVGLSFNGASYWFSGWRDLNVQTKKLSTNFVLQDSDVIHMSILWRIQGYCIKA